MRLRHRTAIGLTITAVLFWPVAGTVTAAAATTYTPLPAHVYAPYYETYLAPNTQSITATAQASGAKYFTLAFIISQGTCNAAINGDTAINPSGFTFIQSVTILMVIILGGMGSLPGVILGAAVIVILPEALRAFDQVRMLAFGIGLILLLLTVILVPLVSAGRQRRHHVHHHVRRTHDVRPRPGLGGVRRCAVVARFRLSETC